jgi:hypothetical protein
MEIVINLIADSTFINGIEYIHYFEIGKIENKLYWRKYDAVQYCYSEWVAFDYNIPCPFFAKDKIPFAI